MVFFFFFGIFNPLIEEQVLINLEYTHGEFFMMGA